MIANATPSFTRDATPVVSVHSALLGPLTVTPNELLNFPAGLFGFPECRSFVLVATERPGMFWLQSVEDGALAFLLVDPFPVFKEYAVDLGPLDLAKLQSSDVAHVAILGIVTLPRSRDEKPTVNLQGPLALNLVGRCGMQMAIPESTFGVRYPFDLATAV